MKLSTLIILTACLFVQSAHGQTQIDSSPPPVAREFRAAWVATVENIDWPSKPGLSTDDQKAEALAIIETAHQLNLNCLVLQVRTTCDALYDSQLEPWSLYLTGESGRPPEPFYDPLTFWIDECHQRGIELHAWLNPYRARFGDQAQAASHLSTTHPELVRQYGNYLWLDPGEPAALEHSLAVFADVVSRYDLDGIHMDDYFYPYPVTEKDQDVPFPDDASWNRYVASGGTLARPDWRRDNVNRLVQRIHEQTRQLKPWVKFGISPFGIGRPGKAPGITGFDQYEKLSADAELWLTNGWCDYFSPQLYWPVDQKPQSFPVLYEYWNSVSTATVPVWPGLFTSRTGDPRRPFPENEILRQIEIVRNGRESSGHIHFSMKALMQNREGLADKLKSDLYSKPALVPPTVRMDFEPPSAPVVSVATDRSVSIRPGDSQTLKVYVVREQTAAGWKTRILPATSSGYRPGSDVQRVVVTSVDRTGNESSAVDLML